MIFVGTSGLYASSSARDANHNNAKQFLASVQERLVTTDYVVDETLTLFRARGESQHAFAFGNEVIDGSFAELITIDDQDFADAWKVFQRFHDKQWSFTDCTSRVVRERLGIARAFAFDEHFRQFGTVAVVP
ncbi:MAG: PIN domain-containing protein [Pirellulales bacterium]